MPRGRRTPVEIQREVYRLVREERITNAAAICRYLERKFPPSEVPSERTIRNLVRELSPPDPSGPWHPSPDDDPEETALVLETIAAVALLKRKWPQITKEHALWIAWLRKGWPDMDPQLAFYLAEDYRARRANQRTTEDLDALLAYTPWRSEEHYYKWWGLCALNLIPAAHINYSFLALPPDPEPPSDEDLAKLFGEEEGDDEVPQEDPPACGS